jgi:hypothetical protein
LNQYRIAVYLAVILAFLQIAFLYLADISTGVEPMLFATAALLIGLWLHSNFIRYAAGVLFLIWAVGFIWAFWSFSTVRASLLFLFLAMAVTFAPLSWLLLASRKFSAEFAKRRLENPPFKSRLRTVLLTVLAILTVVVVFLDTIALLLLPYFQDFWEKWEKESGAALIRSTAEAVRSSLGARRAIALP